MLTSDKLLNMKNTLSWAVSGGTAISSFVPSVPASRVSMLVVFAIDGCKAENTWDNSKTVQQPQKPQNKTHWTHKQSFKHLLYLGCKWGHRWLRYWCRGCNRCRCCSNSLGSCRGQWGWSCWCSYWSQTAGSDRSLRSVRWFLRSGSILNILKNINGVWSTRKLQLHVTKTK